MIVDRHIVLSNVDQLQNSLYKKKVEEVKSKKIKKDKSFEEILNEEKANVLH